MKEKALALLSGGLDSTTALILAQKEYDVIGAVTFKYGQQAQEQELKASQKLCQEYNLAHYVLDIASAFHHSTSALVSGSQKIPTIDRDSLDDFATCTQTAQQVWVPNRNGLFINYASALAESLHAQHVVVGFNAEEAVTFPDNSQDFITAINKALKYSTKNGVSVISPTLSLNKIEIVRELLKHDFNFHLIWSCYHSKEKHCGECESCQRLKRALNHQTEDNQHIASQYLKELFL